MRISPTQRFFIPLLIAATLLLAELLTADDRNFDVFNLLGQWQGNGVFVMPVTGLEMEMEGSASFVRDTSGGYIRTSMIGTKYLYTYQDSGRLYVNPDNDSLLWEVWDGFGRHVFYEGAVNGDTLTGRRWKGKAEYKLTAQMVTPDSLDFRLYYINPDGERAEKARFNLGRVR